MPISCVIKEKKRGRNAKSTTPHMMTCLRHKKSHTWTQEEDRALCNILQNYKLEDGKIKWRNIAKCMADRNAKQIRERWLNHLRPDINKGGWSEKEDQALVELQTKLGNKWSTIAKILQRSDNEVKNHWNSRGHRLFRKSLPVIALEATTNLLRDRFAKSHPANRADSLATIERIADMPHEIALSIKLASSNQEDSTKVSNLELINDDMKQPAVETNHDGINQEDDNGISYVSDEAKRDKVLVTTDSKSFDASDDDESMGGMVSQRDVLAMTNQTSNWDMDLFAFGKVNATSENLFTVSTPGNHYATAQQHPHGYSAMFNAMPFSPAFSSPLFYGDGYAFGAQM